MKKFLCVLLSLGMLLTAANVCAAPGDVVNVALGKPAFANQQYGALSPSNATDGSALTCYAGTWGAAGTNVTFYVDLGETYPIHSLKLFLGGTNQEAQRKNFNIYFTNERPVWGAAGERVLVHEQTEDPGDDVELNVSVPDEAKAEAYRYVVVEKQDQATGLAIREIEVYAPADSVPEKPSYMVEIGRNKTALSNDNFDTSASYMLNDGNAATIVAGETSGTSETGALRYKAWIDLGAAFPIEGVNISITKGNDTWFFIYGSNDPTFAERDTLYTGEGTPLGQDFKFLETPEEMKATPYQYIMVERNNGKAMAISELEVYTTNTAAEETEVSEQNGRVIEIGRGKKVVSNSFAGSYVAENINDGVDSSFWQANWPTTEEHYAFIDMEKPISVARVTTFGVQTVAAGRTDADLKIVATNDPNLAPENWDTLATWEANKTTLPRREMMFTPAAEFAKNTYRFVGISTILGTGTNGMQEQRVAELKVYTYAQDFKETINPIAAAWNSETKTAEISSVMVTNANTPYNMIAAAYQTDEDGNNQMIGVRIQEFSGLVQGAYQPVSMTADLSGVEGIENVTRIRVILVDTLDRMCPKMTAFDIPLS